MIMDITATEPEEITEQLLLDLFYQVEIDLEAARSRRFQTLKPQVLSESMKATTAAFARLRRAIDLAFEAGFDARTLMDAAHLKFIECNPQFDRTRQ